MTSTDDIISDLIHENFFHQVNVEHELLNDLHLELEGGGDLSSFSQLTDASSSVKNIDHPPVKSVRDVGRSLSSIREDERQQISSSEDEDQGNTKISSIPSEFTSSHLDEAMIFQHHHHHQDVQTDFVHHGFHHASNQTVSFCHSGGMGGMIMYMDGFRFSLLGNPKPCLNLFFPGWTLDTRVKFVVAMAGIVSLGIMTEAISKLRFMVKKRMRRHSIRKRLLHRYAVTLLHGLQALLGYILMLATMSFSAELFFCVVFGLIAGYAIFYDDVDTHVTSNPCCDFIQSEADENNQAFLTAAAAVGAVGQDRDVRESGGGGGGQQECCDAAALLSDHSTDNADQDDDDDDEEAAAT